MVLMICVKRIKFKYLFTNPAQNSYFIIYLIKQMIYHIVMSIFHALSDPTRRRIIEMLAAAGQLPARSIAEAFAMSAPAISQHLKILRDAKLVYMKKKAQQRLYSINPTGISEMEQWIGTMRHLWNQHLDRLEIVLRIEAQQPAPSVRE